MLLNLQQLQLGVSAVPFPSLLSKHFHHTSVNIIFIGKDIMFRFIIEYSSFRDFGPQVIGLFLHEDF
jgi:hypothetical protein